MLPLRVPAGSAACAVDTLASACGTGLVHACSPAFALAFASGLAATSRDAETLRGWLDVDAIGDLPLSPTLRWRAVHRLAEIGAADAGQVASLDAALTGDLPTVLCRQWEDWRDDLR